MVWQCDRTTDNINIKNNNDHINNLSNKQKSIFWWNFFVEVKTKRQNLFLIFENDHSKLRILVYSRLKNTFIIVEVRYVFNGIYDGLGGQDYSGDLTPFE